MTMEQACLGFSQLNALTAVIKRRLATLTDIHGGLAPEKQLQTLRFTIQATVVQSRVPQGRLLIQVPTEK